jgi:hypothetical protein
MNLITVVTMPKQQIYLLYDINSEIKFPQPQQ